MNYETKQMLYLVGGVLLIYGGVLFLTLGGVLLLGKLVA